MAGFSCIVIDDDRSYLKVLEALIKKVDFLELIGTYQDSVEGFNAVAKENPDVLFLDIEMPDMTGLQILTGLKTSPEIIVVTGKEHYAVKAFDLDVTDYLIKPLEDRARFLRAVNKVRENLEQKSERKSTEEQEFIFLKVESQYNKVPLQSIAYVEALGDYVKFITETDHFVVHTTMRQVESELPEKDFVRVHRSYIVRIDKIDSIDQNILHLKDKIIPISNSQRQNLFLKAENVVGACSWPDFRY